MQGTLDFHYFGVIPNDLVLMRRIAFALRENATSRNKTVCEADDLVEHYAQRWDARRDIRHFFETGGLRGHIETALSKRRFFERLASKYEACSLVLEIFYEFEIYVSQYKKTQAFIKKQRSLASNKRRHFFGKVAERDGASCKFCRTTENLRLDHTHPVILGGLSVLDNFQILCFQCNSRKGKGERAIHHPQAFYSFARNRHDALLYLLTAISYCEKSDKKDSINIVE